ncbi:SDR family NAD(P)-dependent oxidoreductase [Pseudomonas mangiferae]|uniref:SDR family NAD(P)-dependent oxidoreductase n=1 Tax=Pseudomonas mangiferae TaxID=2593654 RepID=A0A553H484_9PSED|nr:SDR family NAD(P)-dependent oxidoreductase [Pseudomonas mangiferae]TRX76560.1 SDR family NAD(P)-dependent oxidoreductase [Pseudomonas mangiferae]
MKAFDGRVAAITGAGSGMGRELALELARRGCHLALADRDAEGLDETVRRAQAIAPALRVTHQVLDVAERDAVFAWAAASAERHGRINLVFNNAGVAFSSTVEGMQPADLAWIVDINFWGVVHGTQAFLPYLKKSGEGHIVNTSSLFGLLAQPGMGAYNATKFAVRGFTEALRQELDLMGCGVSATCVHPGGVKTGIARASRVDKSLIGLLIDDEQQAREDFEKLFMTDAARAARLILEGVRKNRRRVLVGADARLLDLIGRLLPAGYQALVVWYARRMRRVAARQMRAPQDQRPT